MPDPKVNIRNGGLAPLGKYRNALIFWKIEALLLPYECDLKTPIADIPEEAMNDIFNGTTERLRIPASIAHTTDDYYVEYDGLAKYIAQMADAEMTAASQRWLNSFRRRRCVRNVGRTLEPRGTVVQVCRQEHCGTGQYGHCRVYEFLSQVETKLDKKVGPLLTKF